MIPRSWIAIGAAVVVVGYSAIVFHIGGISARADLKALKMDIKVARSIAKMREDEQEAKHQQLLKDKDRERDEAIAATALEFDAYILSLHKSGGGAGQATQPVRIVAERCDNPADNEAVSAAVNRYRDELREANRERREATARLLKQAQLQTDALIRAQEWAKREQEINQ